MPQYLLTIYQPDGPAPDADTMARIGADLHAVGNAGRQARRRFGGLEVTSRLSDRIGSFTG